MKGDSSAQRARSAPRGSSAWRATCAAVWASDGGPEMRPSAPSSMLPTRWATTSWAVQPGQAGTATSPADSPSSASSALSRSRTRA